MRRRKLLMVLVMLTVVVAVGVVLLWPKSTPMPSHSTARPRSPGILWDSAEPVSGD
jgi:hypothetical protein